jgi:hypothetical protein
MQPYRSIAEDVLAVHAGAKSLLGATSEGSIPGGSIHSSPRQLAAHAVELFEVWHVLPPFAHLHLGAGYTLWVAITD